MLIACVLGYFLESIDFSELNLYNFQIHYALVKVSLPFCKHVLVQYFQCLERVRSEENELYDNVVVLNFFNALVQSILLVFWKMQLTEKRTRLLSKAPSNCCFNQT